MSQAAATDPLSTVKLATPLWRKRERNNLKIETEDVSLKKLQIAAFVSVLSISCLLPRNGTSTWHLSGREPLTSLSDYAVMTVSYISFVNHPTCSSSAIYPFPAGIPQDSLPGHILSLQEHISPRMAHTYRKFHKPKNQMHFSPFLLYICSSIP